MCAVIYCFVHHRYFFGVMHTGMKVRVAHCSLIYRKALRLSRKAQGESTIGMIDTSVANFDNLNLFKVGNTNFLEIANSSNLLIFSGQMVNLLSNDVNRFDYSAFFIHYFWVGPIQLLIVMFITWKSVGPACFVGGALIVAFVPLQSN